MHMNADERGGRATVTHLETAADIMGAADFWAALSSTPTDPNSLPAGDR